MNLKLIIEIFAAGLSILYIFVTLIINSAERGQINSLPSEIDMGAISGSAFAALSNIIDGPVLNLRIIDSFDGSCSGVIPTLFTWRTVEKYCVCSDSVSRKSCSRYSSCRNHTRHTYALSHWRGKKFCLDKLRNEDWKLSQGGSFPCPDGFKLCKGGICVSKSILECPITDLILSNTQPNSTQGTYKNVSTYLDGKSVFISRDTEMSPLVTVTVGIPSTPCINTNVFPLRTLRNNYPIIEIQPVGCDQGGNYGVDDSSHIQIDTDSEWNFHDAGNNIYFGQLPNYRQYVGDEKAVLFSRKKIEFKSDKGPCRSYNYQSLKDVASDLNIFENLRLGCNITSFILCALGILAFIIFAFMECCCRRAAGEKSIILHLSIVFIIIALINALVVLILCAIAVSYIDAIDSNSTLMNELADNDCFKVEGYNSLFNNLQHYILTSFPNGKSYNKSNLALSIVYFILGTVSFIVKLVCMCTTSDYNTKI